MTRLALVSEVCRVQADGRVVAVVVVQPDLMVDDQPRRLTADLAGPAVYSLPLFDIARPGSLPGFGLVKLFLIHRLTPLVVFPPAHRVSLSYADATKKDRPKAALCGAGPLGPDLHGSIITHYCVHFYSLFHFRPKS